MKNPMGKHIAPTKTLFRLSGPTAPPEEPLRLCLICKAAIGEREKCVCVLSKPGVFICLSCRQAYAIRNVTKGELLYYVRDRLELIGQNALLRIALRISGTQPFLDWFYSGGFLETDEKPP